MELLAELRSTNFIEGLFHWLRLCCAENPLLGAPRIHGELLKLGIQISQATVAKYMVRQRKPPSQTRRTFLHNHVKQLVAIDFLVVPTVSFRVLYVFVVLAHHRRHAVHFNVTAHPTAEWTARQIAEAFPWDDAPRDLLHDTSTTNTHGHIWRLRKTRRNPEPYNCQKLVSWWSYR